MGAPVEHADLAAETACDLFGNGRAEEAGAHDHDIEAIELHIIPRQYVGCERGPTGVQREAAELRAK